MNQIVIKFDAACRNIPEENCPMGLGVAVFFDGEYQEDISIAEYFTTELPVLGTSNVGEWNALIRSLEVALSLRKHYSKNQIIILGDSKLIVNQVNLIYRVKEPNFVPFFNQARKLKQEAKIGDILWIPREKNTHADDLSKMGLYEMAPEKRYYVRGYHDGTGEEWVDFEDDDIQLIKKHYWMADEDDVFSEVTFSIMDRLTNTDITEQTWTTKT